MFKKFLSLFKCSHAREAVEQSTPLSVLRLGQAINLRLEKNGVESVEDLRLKMDSLHLIRGFGTKSIDKIREASKSHAIKNHEGAF